ncbi:MAG: hypothetical protein WCX69_01995 [Candidatus Paceibacterota bacterium]
METSKFTNEEIQKIKKALQYIFAPLNKNIISIIPSAVTASGDGIKFKNNDLIITIEGDERPMPVICNRDTLVLNIWNIADQLCDAWKIGKGNPIHDLLWDGDTSRHDKIEEFLKTIK